MITKQHLDTLRAKWNQPDHPLQANFERPRLHHVPQWFRWHMQRNFHVPGQYGYGQGVLRYIVEKFGDDWLDHCGSAIYHGRECFVSQPYNLTSDRDTEIWQQLMKFSTAIKLPFLWSELSDWFPPSTTSVIFFRPGTEAVAS